MDTAGGDDATRIVAGIRALCDAQDGGNTWHGRIGRHFWIDHGKIVRLVTQAIEAYDRSVVPPTPPFNPDESLIGYMEERPRLLVSEEQLRRKREFDQACEAMRGFIAHGLRHGVLAIEAGMVQHPVRCPECDELVQERDAASAG